MADPKTPWDSDGFHEECGVFGVFGHDDAAALCTLGLHALQHRGQEAAGIASYDHKQFHTERHKGLVGDTFTKPSVLARLPGSRAIGHTRYSTTGGEGLRNVQPFFAEFAGGGFAIAHNGNLSNGWMFPTETTYHKGKVDAAFVATHRFDNVVNKGEVALEDFNVLWTSPPIPQDPFVYRTPLCDDLKAKIRDTFLGLKDEPAAKKFLANVKSNTFVSMSSEDYDVIRDLKKAKDAKKK